MKWRDNMQEGYLSIKKGSDSSHQESCQEYHCSGWMRIKSVGVSAAEHPTPAPSPPPSTSQNFLLLPIGETHCISKSPRREGCGGCSKQPGAVPLGRAVVLHWGWVLPGCCGKGGWGCQIEEGGRAGTLGPPCHTTHMHTHTRVCAPSTFPGCLTRTFFCSKSQSCSFP